MKDSIVYAEAKLLDLEEQVANTSCEHARIGLYKQIEFYETLLSELIE